MGKTGKLFAIICSRIVEMLQRIRRRPRDPMKNPDKQAAPEHGVRITEAQVNLRVGPGTDYGIARIAKRSEVFEPADGTGWRPILLDGEVRWVSEKMSEAI